MNSASAQISKFGAVSELWRSFIIHNLKALRCKWKNKIDELLGSFAKLKKSIDPVSKLRLLLAQMISDGKQTTLNRARNFKWLNGIIYNLKKLHGLLDQM